MRARPPSHLMPKGCEPTPKHRTKITVLKGARETAPRQRRKDLLRGPRFGEMAGEKFVEEGAGLVRVRRHGMDKYGRESDKPDADEPEPDDEPLWVGPLDKNPPLGDSNRAVSRTVNPELTRHPELNKPKAKLVERLQKLYTGCVAPAHTVCLLRARRNQPGVLTLPSIHPLPCSPPRSGEAKLSSKGVSDGTKQRAATGKLATTRSAGSLPGASQSLTTSRQRLYNSSAEKYTEPEKRTIGGADAGGSQSGVFTTTGVLWQMNKPPPMRLYMNKH